MVLPRLKYCHGWRGTNNLLVSVMKDTPNAEIQSGTKISEHETMHYSTKEAQAKVWSLFIILFYKVTKKQ